MIIGPYELVQDEFGSRHVRCNTCQCLVCCGSKCNCEDDWRYTETIARQLMPPTPVITAAGT